METSSGISVRQWVGFLKVIKWAAQAETSTQAQGIFLRSPPPAPTQQSIEKLKSLPSKTMHCKHVPSRKQLKGETVGDVTAILF